MAAYLPGLHIVVVNLLDKQQAIIGLKRCHFHTSSVNQGYNRPCFLLSSLPLFVDAPSIRLLIFGKIERNFGRLLFELFEVWNDESVVSSKHKD